MTSLPLFARHFRDLGLTGEGVVSVAPDAGRAKHAVRFAEMIDADFAIMHKTRPAHDVVAVTEVTGRVRGKIAIIGDDITTTGGTLIAGAKALKEHGATDVWVFVTHALISEEGLEKLEPGGLRRDRRHRHRPDRPDHEARQHDGAHRRAAARRDDHERLRRRLRLGDLRRREPALLDRSARFCGRADRHCDLRNVRLGHDLQHLGLERVTGERLLQKRRRGRRAA